jgi:hypothetical protein
MVDMGVGQQDEIDFPRVEAEIQRPQILRARFRSALKHAAIDQKAGVSGFHQRAGTGHFTGGAEKAETHDSFLLYEARMNLKHPESNAEDDGDQ